MQILIDQTTAGGITVNDCNTHYAGIVFNPFIKYVCLAAGSDWSEQNLYFWLMA